jgi:pimeloyl-ACP methyl ester carboxylesterase
MRDTLPKLTLPIRCVWGEDDRFAPPELGRQLEKLLPNIKFTFIPRAGHQVQNDQPETVSRMMIEFFSS